MRIDNIKPVNIKYILLVSALILFHFLNNYIWCSNDWLTTEDDMSDHLASHLLLYTDMKELLSSPLNLISKICGIIKLIKHYSTFAYPPLVYFISSLISVVFNSSHILIARLSNMLYFSILVISVYLIGRVCISRSFGLIAAALVSFYPAVAGTSRLYCLDFPLTSFTAFAVYCLIRTDYFTKFKKSVFFGFALGFGILVKGQILFFVTGPFLYAAIKGLIQKRGINNILKNVIISFLMAGFISSIWWLPHFKSIVHKFSEQVFVSYTGSECPEWIGGLMKLKLFSPDWILAYAYFLLNNITPVLFILFLLGLAGFFRINMKHKGIVLAWLLVSYVLLTIFSVKKDRFFLPAFPAVALISSSFFYNIKNKRLQRTAIVAIIAFSLAQFIFLSHREESIRFIGTPKRIQYFILLRR